jgi:hypothetical protein
VSQKPQLLKAIGILDSMSTIYPKDANLIDSQVEAYLYLWQIEKNLKTNAESKEKLYKTKFYTLIKNAVDNPKDADQISAKYYKDDFRWLFFKLLCDDEFRKIVACKNNIDCPCGSKSL